MDKYYELFTVLGESIRDYIKLLKITKFSCLIENKLKKSMTTM